MLRMMMPRKKEEGMMVERISDARSDGVTVYDAAVRPLENELSRAWWMYGEDGRD